KNNRTVTEERQIGIPGFSHIPKALFSVKSNVRKVEAVMPISKKIDIIFSYLCHNTQITSGMQAVPEPIQFLSGMMQMLSYFGGRDKVVTLAKDRFVIRIKRIVDIHAVAGLFKHQVEGRTGAGAKIKSLAVGLESFIQRTKELC